MQRTRASIAALALLLGLVIGCQSAPDGAKETFTKEKSCPADRVEVKERPEVKTSSFATPIAPPADIAADPARLKIWQDQHAKKSDDDGHHFLSVRGCGKTVLYDCRGPTNEDRPQRPWFCSEVTALPASIAVW